MLKLSSSKLLHLIYDSPEICVKLHNFQRNIKLGLYFNGIMGSHLFASKVFAFYNYFFLLKQQMFQVTIYVSISYDFCTIQTSYLGQLLFALVLKGSETQMGTDLTLPVSPMNMPLYIRTFKFLDLYSRN